MDEVRGLIERELALLLAQVVDCPVLPGEAEDERPDVYVSVVAEEAEARGAGMYLVDVEVRVVVPVDDAEQVQMSRLRLRAICDWLDLPDCPWRLYESASLMVRGYRVGSLTSETGARSRAGIVALKVGAGALL